MTSGGKGRKERRRAGRREMGAAKGALTKGLKKPHGSNEYLERKIEMKARRESTIGQEDVVG